MKLPLALFSALGLTMANPAHALVSLHISAPHATQTISVSEIGTMLLMTGFLLLVGAIGYRYIKAK